MSSPDKMIKENVVDSLWDDFHTPMRDYKSIPKWVWNTPLNNITAQTIYEQLKHFRDHDGYSGVMIVLWGHDKYLTEEYFEKYGLALDIAADLGMSIILWDENGFPTGYAGGAFEAKYPEYTAKRFDMTEIEVAGPSIFKKALPEGKLMGVVAMNTETKDRIDITSFVDSSGQLQYSIPKGHWRIMFFNCVKEGPFQLMGGKYRFIDYLESEAVKRFVQLTHQQYFDRFSQYFGTTIRYAFYDEPSFWRIQGRIWTEGYNQKFEERYGYSPVIYYPALWYDIGSETEAARNALLGFRAELYAMEFVKTLSDWCSEHRIQLTGHMDQEEIVNPVLLSGDLMKVFKYQHIPGVDEIFAYGRGSKAYKIISSAAFNYDKSVVMSETYGAMGEEMPLDVLYKEAMDLYAKGINFMVPHGTWYDNVNDVIFPPELSYRSKKFGSELPEFNRYIGRLSRMMQGGSHISDIGVLYPIAALQAGNRFGEGDAYLGGTIAGEVNYMELGEMLSLKIRRDFTYVHPEVLDEKCFIHGTEIHLCNLNNREQYKVFILPGINIIHWSNMKKLQKFFDNGGKVIAIGQLPYKSAEFGHDEDVVMAVERIFGVNLTIMGSLGKAYHSNTNSTGGKAYYLQVVDTDLIRAALDDALSLQDVSFEDDIDTTGGNFSYIHKFKGDRHIYFFANSSDHLVSTYVRLRGVLVPEIWDPHMGDKSVSEYEHLKKADDVATRVRLELPSVKSLFIVAEEFRN